MMLENYPADATLSWEEGVAMMGQIAEEALIPAYEDGAGLTEAALQAEALSEVRQ